MLSLSEHPHRRYNPLTGEWVVVSPHRTSRPWLGQTEKAAREDLPQYDPECYLCPGNSRAGGHRNPQYESTFVFDNDFAALKPDTPLEVVNHHDLIVAAGEPGLCRVICFSPRHDLTLSNMKTEEIHAVVDVWAEQYREIGNKSPITYVQVFENRGAMMGASNPHPHCQIWGTSALPVEPAKEQARFREYATRHTGCLLCDYLELERKEDARIVLENQSFAALVPFWAVWPFETMVVSKRHVTDLDALDQQQRRALADILGRLTAVYDHVFEVPFPYTMGFHQRPTSGDEHGEWHLHAHFYPPLLRSATVRKFMVGFEMLATPQRDITPEAAAARLRALAGPVPGDHQAA